MPDLRQLAALRAWRYPSFRRYFWANGLSASGRALQTTVIGFIVFDLTGSDFLLGLVAFMQLAPTFVIAPVAGVIVDNFERRRILAVVFAVQATGFLALGFLALSNMLTIPAIAGVVIVMGAAGSFMFPASSALLPNLIERNALQSGVAIGSVLRTGSLIIVPALGGLIIDLAGISIVLFIGAGLYFPAALVILSVPLLSTTVAATVSRRPFDARRTGVRFVTDLRDAACYVRSNLMLRASLVNDIVPYTFGMSYIALLPAIALDTLDGDAGTLGLLQAFNGAGALIGTLTAGLLAESGRRGTVIWTATIGWGAGMLFIGSGSSMSTIVAGLVVTGFFQTLYIVQNDTLVQFFCEDRFRGRVIAAQAMINGLSTIGFLVIGTIAAASSVGIAVAIHGLVLIAMGIVTLVFRPAMRNLR